MLNFLMKIRHILTVCIIRLDFGVLFLEAYTQAYKFHFFHHNFDFHQFRYKFIFHSKKDINIFEFLLKNFLKRFFLYFYYINLYIFYL